jgi:hypothetical protein
MRKSGGQEGRQAGRQKEAKKSRFTHAEDKACSLKPGRKTYVTFRIMTLEG